MDTGVQIHLIGHHRFSCNDCGKCCNNSWRVKLTPVEFDRLSSLKVTDGLRKQGYQPLEVSEGESDIVLREDGSCPYLRDQGCDVHREIGGELKPFTCQVFPFGAVNTPEGYFLSTSFSCPAVLLGSGEPLSEQVTELQRLLAADAMYSDKVQQIMLTEEKAITWDQYKELEAQLLLSEEVWTNPIHRLVKLACWVVSHSSSENVPFVIPANFEQSIVYQEAHNILPFFAVNVISILEKSQDPEERALVAESVATTGGYPSKLIQGATLPIFELCHIPNSITQSVLDRYLHSQIFGKRLLVGPTIATRLLILACALSVLLYYLNLRIENSSTPDMDFDSLEWAFELVETSMVTHASDLTPLFQEFERALFAYSQIET